ncbi:MAG: hypothetical protein Ct9H90mP13_01320 [Pseudomonadota bacterium]|nr:MAG: hypothetical protein Ct9H90mP13_01320 [Pseudomonadota bacterium]
MSLSLQHPLLIFQAIKAGFFPIDIEEKTYLIKSANIETGGPNQSTNGASSVNIESIRSLKV